MILLSDHYCTSSCLFHIESVRIWSNPCLADGWCHPCCLSVGCGAGLGYLHWGVSLNYRMYWTCCSDDLVCFTLYCCTFSSALSWTEPGCCSDALPCLSDCQTCQKTHISCVSKSSYTLSHTCTQSQCCLAIEITANPVHSLVVSPISCFWTGTLCVGSRLWTGTQPVRWLSVMCLLTGCRIWMEIEFKTSTASQFWEKVVNWEARKV